ncbi:MAG: biopolymer transporter ExbD [Deltaproteobacteria bacterium]|nr:biopolymer transporter ExbD [Deltaproteobacteria bacterium]
MSLGRTDADGDDESIVAEINVTPLTDIFLVLLIIFMVTSSALTNQGSKVDLPRADAGAGDTSGVVVTATADGKVEVDGRALAIDQLGGVLAAALQRGPSKSVVLRGDRTMVLEQAVQIMTIAKTAGADKISIATAPMERR